MITMKSEANITNVTMIMIFQMIIQMKNVKIIKIFKNNIVEEEEEKN